MSTERRGIGTAVGTSRPVPAIPRRLSGLASMAAIELDMRRIGREAPRFAGSVAELARWLHDHVVPHRSLTTFLFVFDCIKKMPLTEPDIHECKTTDQAAAVIRRFLGRVQLAAVSGEFTFEERWVRDACGVLCRNALARGY